MASSNLECAALPESFKCFFLFQNHNRNCVEFELISGPLKVLNLRQAK